MILKLGPTSSPRTSSPRTSSPRTSTPRTSNLGPTVLNVGLQLGLGLGLWACAETGPADSDGDSSEGNREDDGSGGDFSDPSAGGSSSGDGGSASGGVSGAGTGGEGSSGAGGNPNSGQTVTLTLEENESGFCDFEGVIESEHVGFSGSGYMNGDGALGAGLEWSLNADGGLVDLTFRYASTADRSATLFVGGISVGSLAFPSTGAFTTWQEETVTVTLSSGANLLRLEADAADGLPNVDRVMATGLGLLAAACPEPEPVDPPDSSDLIGFATLGAGTQGGAGAEVVTATTYAELKSYAESATPYVIMIEGTLSPGAGGGQINVNSNKSLIGVGAGAFVSGVGLGISSRSNIIIQNLRLSLVGVTDPKAINDGDLISISGSSQNIWIDHCELFSENPDTQTDIDKYDGLIDIKGTSGFITISWNYLHDHHKGGLVGSSDTDLFADRKITFHHNYYNKVKLRVPMYRGATGHFFNNYIVGAKDATEIRAGTCVRVEKNYYESLNYSIYTTSDSPGSTERIDNIEVAHASRPYPASCTAVIPYDYAEALTDNTEQVKTLVPAYAGVGKL